MFHIESGHLQRGMDILAKTHFSIGVINIGLLKELLDYVTRMKEWISLFPDIVPEQSLGIGVNFTDNGHLNTVFSFVLLTPACCKPMKAMDNVRMSMDSVLVYNCNAS